MGNLNFKCDCNLCKTVYCNKNHEIKNDTIDKDLYILEKDTIIYNKFNVFNDKIYYNIKNLFDLFFVKLNNDNYDKYIISDNNNNTTYKYTTNKKLSLFIYNFKNVLVPSFEKCIDKFLNKGYDGIVYIDKNNKIICIKLCNYQNDINIVK